MLTNITLIVHVDMIGNLLIIQRLKKESVINFIESIASTTFLLSNIVLIKIKVTEVNCN